MMRVLLAAVLVLGLGLSPAAAEEGASTASEEDWIILQGCLEGTRESGEPRSSCVGAISNPCLATPGNDTTVMMGICLEQEAGMWDDLLNQVYGDLMGVLDAEMKQRLKAAQRSWIMVRDETCELEMAQWGGGTGAPAALVGCLMRETGFRTSQLMDILDMAAGQ